MKASKLIKRLLNRFSCDGVRDVTMVTLGDSRVEVLLDVPVPYADAPYERCVEWRVSRVEKVQQWLREEGPLGIVFFVGIESEKRS